MSTPTPNPPQQPAPSPNSPQQPAPLRQAAPAQQSNRPVRPAQKKREGLKESTRKLKAASQDHTPFLARMFCILPFFQPFLLLLGVAALLLLAWPVYGIYRDAQAEDQPKKKQQSTDATDTLNTLDSVVGELKTQIAKFQTESEELRKERDNLAAEKDDLHEQVRTLTVNNAKLITSEERLRVEKSKMSDELGNVRNEVVRLTKQIAVPKGKEDLVASLRTENSKLKDDLEAYKQGSVKFQSQIEAFKTELEKSSKMTTSLELSKAQLEKKLGDLEKVRDGLFAELEKLFVTKGNSVSPFVDETAKQLTSVVEQQFGLRLQNQMKKLGEIDVSLRALRGVVGRRARKEKVALIVYDSTRIRSEKYASIVKQLLEKNHDATVYANYDWGVYTATTGRVLVEDAPLALGETSSGKSVNLNVPSNTGQEPDVSGTDPKQIFTAPPVADTKRRCILVLPADAKAPDANAQKWKDLQVDVVLVDATQPEQVSKTIANQWLKWHNFCQSGGGEAVLVPVKLQSRELSDDSKESIRLRLERLLHPRHS